MASKDGRFRSKKYSFLSGSKYRMRRAGSPKSVLGNWFKALNCVSNFKPLTWTCHKSRGVVWKIKQTIIDNCDDDFKFSYYFYIFSGVGRKRVKERCSEGVMGAGEMKAPISITYIYNDPLAKVMIMWNRFK